MIQEDYCSFEVAKLLKDKGFDEPCHYYYRNNTLMFDASLNGRNSYQHNENIASAPTHQMAMKWLREVYGIHVSAIPCTKPQHIIVWQQNIINLNPIREGGMFLQLEPNKKCYNSYEESVEAAIKYLLENLI